MSGSDRVETDYKHLHIELINNHIILQSSKEARKIWHQHRGGRGGGGTVRGGGQEHRSIVWWQAINAPALSLACRTAFLVP